MYILSTPTEMILTQKSPQNTASLAIIQCNKNTLVFQEEGYPPASNLEFGQRNVISLSPINYNS